MKEKVFRYGNILLLSTLQFEGHFREHFVANSKKEMVEYKKEKSRRQLYI